MNTWRNFILCLLFPGYCFEPRHPDAHWHQDSSQTVQAWPCYSQEWNRWKNRVKWGAVRPFFLVMIFFTFIFRWKKKSSHDPLNKNRDSCLSLVSASLTEYKYFHRSMEWFGFEKTLQIMESNLTLPTPPQNHVPKCHVHSLHIMLKRMLTHLD